MLVTCRGFFIPAPCVAGSFCRIIVAPGEPGTAAAPACGIKRGNTQMHTYTIEKCRNSDGGRFIKRDGIIVGVLRCNDELATIIGLALNPGAQLVCSNTLTTPEGQRKAPGLVGTRKPTRAERRRALTPDCVPVDCNHINVDIPVHPTAPATCRDCGALLR